MFLLRRRLQHCALLVATCAAVLAEAAAASAGSGAPADTRQQAGGAQNRSLAGPHPLGPAPSPDDSDRASIIATAVAGLLIFTVGFLGNALVILVILRFTKTESVTDIYILNLALADLMFVTGLIFLATTMSLSYWAFGNLMCKLYMATTSLNQFASSLLLVVMSFDRFLAVCHPIYAQRFRRTRRAKAICLAIWAACLVLMAPVFVFAKMDDTLTCGIFWPEYKTFNCEMAFTLYSFALGFSLPLLLIGAFYACVIKKLRSSSQHSLGTSRRSRGRETTNRRIEHLVIGIICTYTLCWAPYWITQLCVSLLIVDERAPIAGFYQFFLLASCLSYTNSALNPILYAFLSDNFKRRFSDALRSLRHLLACCGRLGPGAAAHTSGAASSAACGGGSGPQARAHHSHLCHSAATTHLALLDTDLDTCGGGGPEGRDLELGEIEHQPEQVPPAPHR